MIDIHLVFERYEHFKGLAIIQEFTAYWVIQNEQMVTFWKFYSVRMQVVFIFDPEIDSNFKTFTICLFFIAQWAVKSYIIAIYCITAII